MYPETDITTHMTNITHNSNTASRKCPSTHKRYKWLSLYAMTKVDSYPLTEITSKNALISKCYFLRKYHRTKHKSFMREFPSCTHLTIESNVAMWIKYLAQGPNILMMNRELFIACISLLSSASVKRSFDRNKKIK